MAGDVTWMQPTESGDDDDTQFTTTANSLLRNLSYFSRGGSEERQPNLVVKKISEPTPRRQQLMSIVDSPWFDALVGGLVAFNTMLTVLDTDRRSECWGKPKDVCDPKILWVSVANLLLVGLFSMELVLRLVAFRWRFFRSIWNSLDAFVIILNVVCEVIDVVGSSLVWVRLVRLLRMARIIRIFSSFRELYIIMHGMMTTFKAICWAGLLLLVLLTIWSVVAVDLLQPEVRKIFAAGGYDECPSCESALSSVYSADLTLFEAVILGENFGQLVFPLAKSSPWTLLIILGIFVTCVMGLMNLVFAVIVDVAVDAREQDLKYQTMIHEKKRREAMEQLMSLCSELDVDQGGTLTLTELQCAFEQSIKFRQIMAMADIDRDDLEAVFKIMDADGSGDVSYTEFADLLYKMKAQNSRTLLMFIKHHALEIKQTVQQQIAQQIEHHGSVVERMVGDIEALLQAHQQIVADSSNARHSSLRRNRERSHSQAPHIPRLTARGFAACPAQTADLETVGSRRFCGPLVGFGGHGHGGDEVPEPEGPAPVVQVALPGQLEPVAGQGPGRLLASTWSPCGNAPGWPNSTQTSSALDEEDVGPRVDRSPQRRRPPVPRARTTMFAAEASATGINSTETTQAANIIAAASPVLRLLGDVARGDVTRSVGLFNSETPDVSSAERRSMFLRAGRGRSSDTNITNDSTDVHCHHLVTSPPPTSASAASRMEDRVLDKIGRLSADVNAFRADHINIRVALESVEVEMRRMQGQVMGKIDELGDDVCLGSVLQERLVEMVEAMAEAATLQQAPQADDPNDSIMWPSDDQLV